jgi:hypothetical protein
VHDRTADRSAVAPLKPLSTCSLRITYDPCPARSHRAHYLTVKRNVPSALGEAIGHGPATEQITAE